MRFALGTSNARLVGAIRTAESRNCVDARVSIRRQQLFMIDPNGGAIPPLGRLVCECVRTVLIPYGTVGRVVQAVVVDVGHGRGSIFTA